MRIALFYHSLLSDWNHGNAHFLRGIASELLFRGHDLRIYEPRNAWSLKNLLAQHGPKPLEAFRKAYPTLKSRRYDPLTLDLDAALDGVQLVLVHEWNDPAFVARIGRHHARNRAYRLLFHDTHHRAVTDPQAMARYDLSHFDGVLAFGQVLSDLYRKRCWTQHAWTWHEAADTRLFRPIANLQPHGDLVWIGNWGDEERTAELHEFLIDPIQSLSLRARLYGVRYPASALKFLKQSRIAYGGWLANYRVPGVFARFPLTLHIPRRPYVQALPGIPTIRVFEALACGIPLICSPWPDAEHLFTPGRDFLIAQNGREMKRLIRMLIHEPQARADLARHGHRTLLSRHTCAHRADELLAIYSQLAPPTRSKPPCAQNSTSRSSAQASSPPTGTARPLTTAV